MSTRRTAQEARQLLRVLLEIGAVGWTNHAKKEMAKDGVTIVDAVNVLRRGVVEEPEYENGEWRYRVRIGSIVVVCELGEDHGDESPIDLMIVTVWREQR